jgi:hypothetical protein
MTTQPCANHGHTHQVYLYGVHRLRRPTDRPTDTAAVESKSDELGGRKSTTDLHRIASAYRPARLMRVLGSYSYGRALAARLAHLT